MGSYSEFDRALSGYGLALPCQELYTGEDFEQNPDLVDQGFEPGTETTAVPTTDQPESEIAAQRQESHEPAGNVLGQAYNIVKNNKVVTAAAVIAVASFFSHPVGDTLKAAGDVWPYALVGGIALEAGWCVGAGMMLAQGGKKILKYKEIKEGFKNIANTAEDSKLFKMGAHINLAAALGQFALPTALVVGNLPVQTWGILSVCFVDLWTTIVFRKAIWRGVRKHKEKPNEQDEQA